MTIPAPDMPAGPPDRGAVPGPVARAPRQQAAQPRVAQGGAHSASRSPGRVGGSPGLTLLGSVVLVLTGGALGLVLDHLIGGGLGWIFGATFVAMAVVSTLMVRRKDMVGAVIAVPLVFVGLLAVDALLTGSGSLVSRLVGVPIELVQLGPALWVATGLAALVAVVRALVGRSGASRRRAAPAARAPRP